MKLIQWSGSLMILFAALSVAQAGTKNTTFAVGDAVETVKTNDRNKNSVELVALGRTEGTNKVWWTPTGTLLKEMPTNVTRQVSPFDANVDFLVTAKPGWVKVGNGDTGPYIIDPVPLGPIDEWKFTPSKDGKTGTLRVAVGDGDWQSLCTTDGRQAVTNRTELGQVEFTSAIESNQWTHIEVRHRIAQRQVRVVAVDTNDRQRVDEHGGTALTLDHTRIHEVFFLIPPSRIRQIELQQRPYEWIEFRDLPLRPKN